MKWTYVIFASLLRETTTSLIHEGFRTRALVIAPAAGLGVSRNEPGNGFCRARPSRSPPLVYPRRPMWLDRK